MVVRPTRRADPAEPLVIELDGDDGTGAPGLAGALAVDLDPSPLSVATGRALVAVRHLVDAGPAGDVGWAVSLAPAPDTSASSVMTHYVLGPPDDAAAAVTRFLDERGGRVRSLWGSVRLERVEPDRPVLATWRGRLRLHTSPAPIPIELDVEPWRSVGLMLTVRPVRRHGRRIGAHRRWAWFHTGHGVLEQVRLAVEQPNVTAA